MTLSELVGEIDTKRQQGNLSSAIRLFVLDYFKSRTAGPSGEPKLHASWSGPQFGRVQANAKVAPAGFAISLPYSSLERDFCRWRQTRNSATLSAYFFAHEVDVISQ